MAGLHIKSEKHLSVGELTYRYQPDECNFGHGFGSGVVLAVLDRLFDGDVAIEGDGAKVHDGCRGE